MMPKAEQEKREFVRDNFNNKQYFVFVADSEIYETHDGEFFWSLYYSLANKKYYEIHFIINNYDKIVYEVTAREFQVLFYRYGKEKLEKFYKSLERETAERVRS